MADKGVEYYVYPLDEEDLVGREEFSEIESLSGLLPERIPDILKLLPQDLFLEFSISLQTQERDVAITEDDNKCSSIQFVYDFDCFIPDSVDTSIKIPKTCPIIGIDQNEIERDTALKIRDNVLNHLDPKTIVDVNSDEGDGYEDFINNILPTLTQRGYTVKEAYFTMETIDIDISDNQVCVRFNKVDDSSPAQEDREKVLAWFKRISEIIIQDNGQEQFQGPDWE